MYLLYGSSNEPIMQIARLAFTTMKSPLHKRPPILNCLYRTLGVVVLLVGTILTAEARPPFLALFKDYYKVDSNSALGQAGCKTCHAEGTTRNPYGKELSKLVKMSDDGKLTDSMLKQVENFDSDGDGYKNGDEITQGSLPGDPNVHPEGKPGDPPKKVAASSPGMLSTLLPANGFHPVVVHFPIALFLFGVLLEILGIRKSNSELGKAAGWNLVGALASLSIVAPSGIAAWLLGGHKLEGTMLIHMLLAITSLGLMIATLVARKKFGHTDKVYLVVLILTAIIVGLTGHFGGQLVYG